MTGRQRDGQRAAREWGGHSRYDQRSGLDLRAPLILLYKDINISPIYPDSDQLLLRREQPDSVYDVGMRTDLTVVKTGRTPPRHRDSKATARAILPRSAGAN